MAIQLSDYITDRHEDKGSCCVETLPTTISVTVTDLLSGEQCDCPVTIDLQELLLVQPNNDKTRCP